MAAQVQQISSWPIQGNPFPAKFHMLSRVVETDTEVLVKHYCVLSAAVALVFAWLFGYLTFGTERGGVLTLLLATFCLVLAAGLAEIRTSRFDRTTKTLETTKLGTLGAHVTLIPFADMQGFTMVHQGNKKLAREVMTLHTRADGNFVLASYLVLREEGGDMDQYMQDWLAEAGWRPVLLPT